MSWHSVPIPRIEQETTEQGMSDWNQWTKMKCLGHIISQSWTDAEEAASIASDRSTG